MSHKLYNSYFNHKHSNTLSSGSLKNAFDQDKVQQELDLQVQVTQKFDQNRQAAKAEINQSHDVLKKRLAAGEITQSQYNEKVAQLNAIGLVLDGVAAGLSTPSNGVGGVVAATASPLVTQKVGELFKTGGALNEYEGTALHGAAQGLVAAAVAAAGGNNALSAGLAAGGAEVLAPRVSAYLYGTSDSAKLTAEQKDTVANIMGLAGVGVGAVVGNSSANAAQGSLSAQNAVENNYEIFSKYKNGKPIIKPQPEKGMVGSILEKLMPATMSGVVRDKQEATALQEIAKLRSEITGPLVLTAGYAPYAAGAIVVSPEVFATAKTACMLNPVGCTELGIIIAEAGAGVPVLNPMSGGKVRTNIAQTKKVAQSQALPKTIAYNASSELPINLPHPRIQSRINLQNGNNKVGWEHVVNRHFKGGTGSQFSISQDELKLLLQDKSVVAVPITKARTSVRKINNITTSQTIYERVVKINKNIGFNKFNNNQPTNIITIQTDKYGNLITTTPGRIQ